jgi:hypothetical protein
MSWAGESHWNRPTHTRAREPDALTKGVTPEGRPELLSRPGSGREVASEAFPLLGTSLPLMSNF